MHHLRQVLTVGALLLPLALAAGCSDGTAPQGDFFLTGRWADAAWVGDAEAVLVRGATGTDTLYVLGVRPPNAGQYPEEIISVRVPFAGSGTYELAADAVEFTVLTGGDVVSAQYNGRSPTAGTLAVELYNAATGLITGTVAFDADARTEFRPYGPEARFASGRFRASVRRAQ